MSHSATRLDESFQKSLKFLLQEGRLISGRTGENRISLRHKGVQVHTYDLGESGNELPLSGLRKASPLPAIAETLFYLTGKDNIWYMGLFNKTLENIWKKWASNDGYLGGVYGQQFRGRKFYSKRIDQFERVVTMLQDDSTKYSTHIRMTTLIPSKFPDSNLSYHENVMANKFALMPCMHSYHFLVSNNIFKEELLNLTITQASSDEVIGRVPHNTVQAAIMLKIVATLTGLKTGQINHVVHDSHYYENQKNEVQILSERTIPKDNQPMIKFTEDINLDLFDSFADILDFYKTGIEITGVNQNEELKIKVDS